MAIVVRDAARRSSARAMRTSVSASTDDVGPGETTEFRVERQVELDDIECIVLEVTGPLPFGISLD